MSIENLLKEVNSILKKYEEFEKLTGEKFNVFKILKIDRSELKHSAFLAELLDPNGSHGLGYEFLKHFVRIFRVDNFSDDDCNNSKVTCEFPSQNISEDYSSGGRVDIMIVSGKNEIIIENKIDAGDGYRQLVRYKKDYPKASLIYLTLMGTRPTKHSVGDLVEGLDYTCNSYNKDIIEWLTICREKSVSHSMLRECISQYINLIKLLTHQSSNKMQDMDIQKLILESAESFNTAKNISSQFQLIKKNIFDSCKREILNAFQLKYGEIQFKLFNYEGFDFYIKISTEQKSGNLDNEYFHIDLWPYKIENKKMVYANEPQLAIFRNMAMEFQNRPKDNFHPSRCYTVFVKSQFDLSNLNHEEYKLLNIDRTEWVKNVMNEANDFIEHMVKSLNNRDDLNTNFYSKN